MSLDGCPVRSACGHHAVITLPTQIDMTNAAQIDGELARVLDERPAVLVVDMTATVFCASDGVHALVRARHRAAAAGAGLRVAVSARIVRRMLELTGMDELLDIYPDLDLALAGPPPPPDDGHGSEASTDDGRQFAASQPDGGPAGWPPEPGRAAGC